MRILLDTHTFLWFVEGQPNFSVLARTMIEDVANQRFLSIASVWEIAIKVSVGKLALRGAIERVIPRLLYENDIALLDVTIDHLAQIVTPPFHHRDPFRLLIAQAIIENLILLSADSVFDAYTVNRAW